MALGIRNQESVPRIQKKRYFKRIKQFMEPAKNFTDLIVWQKAHKFVLDVYLYTSKFPREEIYALTSQFRRATVSIASNIAEGFKKKSNKDKIRFYNISQGSVEECRYYLILSTDLKYGENRQLSDLITEISKILDAYITAIDSNLINSES